ncbi:hypothetical protein C8F04DRAFT_1047971 [Mycena alexandri]|uniref:Uncharacterized protein n=1 Tax=Mycena alexandri TaxID=1745969 RepID=A0AAD6WSP0_9AGAR|nr:hypothetical protein C8F04DRAFT_1047971 [Mycena alexandri]
MLTKPGSFPRRRPVDSPPPLRGEIVDGRPTPRYALAWVCSDEAFYKNLSVGEPRPVSLRNFTTVVSKKWRSDQTFGQALKPIPYPRRNGDFYLIAMFNDRAADHLTRVRNPAGDPLIQSARRTLGVDQDPTIEKTLQWFRFP